MTVEATLRNALRDAIPYLDTAAARSESLSGEALMPKVIADTFREWTEADPLAGVRDFWTGVVDVTRADLAAAQAELETLRKEAEHRAAVSDIVWRRMREATERWQKAHPEIKDVELIWPDLGEMLYWLLERITTLETGLRDLLAGAEHTHKMGKATAALDAGMHSARAALGPELCGMQSSITDAVCTLPKGHRMWSMSRFHRFEGLSEADMEREPSQKAAEGR